MAIWFSDIDLHTQKIVISVSFWLRGLNNTLHAITYTYPSTRDSPDRGRHVQRTNTNELNGPTMAEK